MKKKAYIGIFVLSLCGLVACQEGLSSLENSALDSSNEAPISSSDISSSNNVSTPSNKYVPIDTNFNIDVFSQELSFDLNMNKISKDQAEELVNNDISKYPTSDSSTYQSTSSKRTTIIGKKEETHVTVNRSTSTYSVKDLIEEKTTINKIDSDYKWSYRRSSENTRTVYFKEPDLIRHVITEQLDYIKDGNLYHVYANQSYYEGMEEKGTFEAYFTKRSDFSEEDYGTTFDIYLDGYVYFNSTNNLNKLDKSIYNNFVTSSSYYTADDYKGVARDTNYDYYSSDKNGDFGCVAKDTGSYSFSDLRDYPSMEKSELNTINYQQDYLLNISSYFTYEENSLIKSVSTKRTGTVIRDETKESRKKVMVGCEIFYPDLSKFKEIEYTPPVIK